MSHAPLPPAAPPLPVFGGRTAAVPPVGVFVAGALVAAGAGVFVLAAAVAVLVRVAVGVQVGSVAPNDA